MTVCWWEATDVAERFNMPSWNLSQKQISSQQCLEESGPVTSCTAKISREAQTEFKMLSLQGSIRKLSYSLHWESGFNLQTCIYKAFSDTIGNLKKKRFHELGLIAETKQHPILLWPEAISTEKLLSWRDYIWILKSSSLLTGQELKFGSACY